MFGSAEDEFVELRLDVGQFLVEAGHALAEFLADDQQRRNVLALGFRLADALGVGIARGTHFVRSDLRRLATILERLEALDVEREATAREVRGDGGRVGTEQLGVEHGKSAGNVDRGRIVASCTLSRLSSRGAGSYFPPLERDRARTRSSASPILISSPRGTGS